MKQLMLDYKKSLKPSDTEELVNLVFFRPVAFLFVLIVREINFSPNYYTITSLLCGLLSAYCFYRGSLAIASLFLYLMISFDCADGQLARLKGISTKYGKMMDIVADVISYIAMLLGIALYRFVSTGDPLVFFYGALAFSSLAANVFFLDHFKNQYILYVYKDYHDRVDPISKLHKHYTMSKGIKRAANYVYYQLYRFETIIMKLGCLSDLGKSSSVLELQEFKPSAKIRNLYKKEFSLSLRLWTFAGSSSHFILIIPLALLNRIEWVFAVFVVYSIFMCIITLIFQNLAHASYKKKLKTISP